MSTLANEDSRQQADPGYLVSLWKSELERAHKKMRSWETQADKINKKYRAEKQVSVEQQVPAFQILWSNIQTLLPALYSKPPVPVVQRRFLDKDPTGRTACEVLERCLKYEVDSGHLHQAVELAIVDYALIGRGAAWVRYDPEFETVQVKGPNGKPITDEDGEPVTNEQIEHETVPVDYITWKDFRHGPARIWKEVPWVAKRVYLSRDKLIELTGDEELARKVPRNYGPDGQKNQEAQTQFDELMRAEVWEIWVKDTKEVIWICPDFSEQPLKQLDDPLELQEFFPCPEPCYSTRTTDELVPVPDYAQYQGQAIELDDTSRRIERLIAACKAVGTYDGSIPVLGRMLTEGVENDLIANDNWQMMAAQGGLRGSMDFMPIEIFANVAKILMDARSQAKADIYEITGLSDIIRGNSDPDETAKAQQIKGQYASIRLKDRQKEIARFVRDIIRIQAEIICKQFQPETMWEMSGAAEMQDAVTPQNQPNPMWQQQFMAAVQLLRDERLRGFRIDIETDSTIVADEEAEKASRMEFIEQIGKLIGQALPAVEQYPAILPLLGQIILFAVRGFRVGRELEGVFEEAIEQIEKNPPQPQPNKDQQALQAKIQLEQQQMQAKLQMDQQKAQMDAQFEQEKFQKQAAIEQQQAQADMAVNQQKAQLEMQQARERHALEMEKLQAELQMRVADHQMKSSQLQTQAQIQQHTIQSQQNEKASQAAQKSSKDDAMGQHLAQLAKGIQALAAPKKIVRDQQGRVSHVEAIVMPNSSIQ